jgi:hypothetical protein
MQYIPSSDDIRNFNRIPCLRESMVRGLGCGLLAAVAWGALSRSARRVGDGFFLGWMGASLVSWGLCRRNERIRREAVQRMMLAQSQAPDMAELQTQRVAEASQADEVVATRQ